MARGRGLGTTSGSRDGTRTTPNDSESHRLVCYATLKRICTMCLATSPTTRFFRLRSQGDNRAPKHTVKYYFCKARANNRRRTPPQEVRTKRPINRFVSCFSYTSFRARGGLGPIWGLIPPVTSSLKSLSCWILFLNPRCSESSYLPKRRARE
jgi:hypothetical protein